MPAAVLFSPTCRDDATRLGLDRASLASPPRDVGGTALASLRRLTSRTDRKGERELVSPSLTKLTGESGVPVLRRTCHAVLDLGCGSDPALDLLDLPDGAMRVAMDVDRASLRALPRRSAHPTHRVVADGEALPFRARSFGLVITRVALPYMNVPVALWEMSRVLRADGEVWMTLHPVRMAVMRILADVKALRFKDLLYQPVEKVAAQLERSGSMLRATAAV